MATQTVPSPTVAARHRPAGAGSASPASTVCVRWPRSRCSSPTSASSPSSTLLSPIRAVLGRLDIGVPVFFVISGFLLYRPFVDTHLGGERRPALRTYVRHRFLRIYPAYWAALVGALLIIRQPHGVGELFSWFTLIHLYWPGHLPIGLQQSWSLAVEVSFYALLPAWAWLAASAARGHRRAARAARGARPGRVRRGVVGVAGGRCSRSAAHRTFGPLSFLPAYLDQFAFGMVLALITSPAFRETARGVRAWAVLDRNRRWLTAALLGAAAIAFWTVATRFDLPTASIAYTGRQDVFRHLFYGLFGLLVVAPLALVPALRLHAGPRHPPPAVARPGQLRHLPLARVHHRAVAPRVPGAHPRRRLRALLLRPGAAAPRLGRRDATVAVAIASFAFVEVPALRLAHGRVPSWVPALADHRAGRDRRRRLRPAGVHARRASPPPAPTPATRSTTTPRPTSWRPAAASSSR